MARVPRATISVSQCISPNPRPRARMVGKKGPFGTGMPSTLPNWPTRMSTPTPALKPVSTGSEMKLARNPRRRMAARRRKTPVRKARVAAGTI